jgi:HEAT repeat protein
MKARRTFLLTVLVTVCVGIALMLLVREPRYHGRTLTSWLEQIEGPPWDETQKQQAQDAVRAIGADKALPYLLRLAKAEDDSVSLWLIAKSKDLKIEFIRWRSAEELQQLAIVGFQAFGTNTAPAVGELEKLLDKPSNAETAAECLVAAGKAAEPALCLCLTNQDLRVRRGAIIALASVTDDMETYINRIKGSLHDPSEFVRGAAVEALSAQTAAPDLVVPLLVSALHDSSDIVSCRSAEGLADFGTNALVAVPVLTNLIEHAPRNTANAVLMTITTIAPNESLVILSQCIARGYPSIGGALKLLADTSPDKALPLILAGTHSSDAAQRRVSLVILQGYPPTAQIRSVMERAAADPDRMTSLNAQRFLTGLYLKEHPVESQFSNEPVYLGKGLDEWLRTGESPSGTFPKETQDAIRSMGTNAIPALVSRVGYVQPPYGIRMPGGRAVNLEAVIALNTLGDMAIPALPQLEALMDSTNRDVALFAMAASAGTGSNAMPLFIKGLTNQFADVRNEAANFISDTGSKYPGQQRQAIPLMVKLLNDPDANVRMSATNELRSIAPDVAAKVGVK